jgi:hypothetical protein
VDTYSIRKKVDGANNVRYECWMYRTPVLTYNEDGNIVIDMGGWPSASTRTFISEVLGFSCGHKDGSSYISLPMGNVVMPRIGPTVVRRGADGSSWELIMSARVAQVELKRKAANAVRARYKEFTNYVNNMIKLREDTVGYGMLPNVKIIKMGFVEFKDVFDELGALNEPHTVEAMFRCIAHGIVNDSTESFYKAFMLLVASTHNVQGFGKYTSNFNIQPKTLTDKLKELIYKHHSDEVFERVELPIGKLPNRKYENWM